MPSQTPHCIYVDIPTPSLDLGDLFLVDEPLDSGCILPGHLCVEIPTAQLDFGDNLFSDLQVCYLHYRFLLITISVVPERQPAS